MDAESAVAGGLERRGRADLGPGEDGVGDRDAGILDERLRGRVGGCREGELLRGGQVFEHIGGGGRDGQQQEAPDAGVRESRGALRGRLDAQGDAGAFVDERGVAADDAPGHLRVDDGGEVADVPRRQAGPLERRCGGRRPGGGRRVRRAGGGAERARDRLPGAAREAVLQRAEVPARPDGAPALVDGAERDEQVRGDAGQVEVGGRDPLVRDGLDAGGQGVEEARRRQPFVGLRAGADEGVAERRGPVRRGDHVAADRLGECAQQRRDELAAEPRHLPVEAVRAQLREEGERHDDADAVVGCPGLEPVGEGEHLIALRPARREVALVGARGVVDQVGGGHVQKPRGACRGLPPPRLERADVEDVAGHPRGVERVHGLVADEDVAAALALLDLLQVPPELEVPALEGRELLVQVMRVPLAVDEGVPQEQLAGEFVVDPRELHAPARDDLHPEERHLLRRDGGTGILRPVRIADAAVREVARELFGPGRVDRRDRPGEQARGLHELGRHDGIRRRFPQPRSGEDRELRAPRAPILGHRPSPLVGLRAAALPGAARVEDADVREQSGQDGAMDGGGIGGGALGRGRARGRSLALALAPPLAGELPQLTVHVEPLPHPHVVQVLRTAQAPERARTELGLLLLQVVPEVQQRQEVARRVGEPRVQAVRLLAALLGALADVLDREPGDDREDVGGDVQAPRLQQHPGEPRIDGEPRDLAARLRELRGGTPGDGLQLGEELERRLHAAGVRGRQERELRDVAEAEGEHLQDDGCQGRPQDLRLGELRPGREVLLRVQPDRDAGGGAPRAAGPLLRGRLRDRLDRQPLDLRARAVPRDAGGAGVDDVPDAGDREARLGHVRGEDDAAPDTADAGRLEHAVLLGGGEPAEQRQHLGGAGVLRVPAADGIRRVADLRLAGQEDEHVAVGLAVELAERAQQGIHLVVGLVVRAVADLDGVRASGDLDDGGGRLVRSREVAREALRVDRRRRHDDLQVGALREDPDEVAEQEVDVERPLVRLVDDDRVVAAQQPVAVDLVQEDAVGQERDLRVGGDLIGEAHLEPHGGAERHVELLRDPLRDRPGRDAAGLGVRDRLPAELEADLGELRRLARPGRAGHDDDLVLRDGARDLLPRGADGQLRRVVDAGFRRGHSVPSYDGPGSGRVP